MIWNKNKEKGLSKSRKVSYRVKIINYNNQKREKQSCVLIEKSGEPSQSTCKQNVCEIFCLRVDCTFGGIIKTWYELIKLNETFTTIYYQE